MLAVIASFSRPSHDAYTGAVTGLQRLQILADGTAIFRSEGGEVGAWESYGTDWQRWGGRERFPGLTLAEAAFAYAMTLDYCEASPVNLSPGDR